MPLSNRAVSSAYDLWGATSLSWNHNVGAGSNRVIYIAAAGQDSNVSGVTVSGSSAALIASVAYRYGLELRLYRLVNPPTGGVTIVISWPSTTFGRAGIAVSYSDWQEDTSDSGPPPTAAGTSPDANLIVPSLSADGETLSFYRHHDTTREITVDAAGHQTIIARAPDAAETFSVAGAATQHPNANHYYDVGGGASNRNWGIIGLSVVPVGGGGGGGPSVRRLLNGGLLNAGLINSGLVS